MNPGDGVIHLRHLQFAFEVGDGPQALHDEVGTYRAGEIDHQTGKHGDPHIGQVRDALLDHLLAFLEREERLALLRVAHGGDDHFVEELGRDLDDLDVAVVERIKGSRVEDDGHGFTPAWRGNERFAPP